MDSFSACSLEPPYQKYIILVLGQVLTLIQLQACLFVAPSDRDDQWQRLYTEWVGSSSGPRGTGPESYIYKCIYINICIYIKTTILMKAVTSQK